MSRKRKVKSDIRDGISALENITDYDGYTIGSDVPIRKIELERSTGIELTPDNNDCNVVATIFPSNATYCSLKWSIVTASGIETNLATVTEKENLSAVVHANGDGTLRLRCSADNGSEFPQVLSEYEFTANGFGQPVFDPYTFVTACLYSDSISLMDEVRCGGVSITADNNIVGFKKTDFGKYGTDE